MAAAFPIAVVVKRNLLIKSQRPEKTFHKTVFVFNKLRDRVLIEKLSP